MRQHGLNRIGHWSPEYGAVCPGCGNESRSHRNQKTMKFYRGMRLRYHTCLECGQSFQTTEIDFTQVPFPAGAA